MESFLIKINIIIVGGTDSNTTFRPILIIEYSHNNKILGNASKIAEKSENIGAKVNYGKQYTTASGTTSSDWEILYADDINVYIITTGVLTAGDLSASVERNSGYNGTTDFSTKTTTIDTNKYPAVVDGWLYKIYSEGALLYSSDKSNMKATEYLLDSTNPKWSGLKNNYAKWVIGGPTLELLVESYNAVNTSNRIAINDVTGNGYEQTLGENTLPNTENNGVSYNPWNHGERYWLACPAKSNNSNDNVRYLRTLNASLEYNVISTAEYGFRPVVCLNSNVKLEWNETTQKYDLNSVTE